MQYFKLEECKCKKCLHASRTNLSGFCRSILFVTCCWSQDDQVGSGYLLFFVSKGYPAFFKSTVQLLVHKLVTACSGVQKVDLVSCEPWIVSFPLQSGLLNFKCSCERVRVGNQFTANTPFLKYLRKTMGFYQSD